MPPCPTLSAFVAHTPNFEPQMTHPPPPHCLPTTTPSNCVGRILDCGCDPLESPRAPILIGNEQPWPTQLPVSKPRHKQARIANKTKELTQPWRGGGGRVVSRAAIWAVSWHSAQ